MIRGTKCFMRTIDREDLPFLRDLWDDPEVVANEPTSYRALTGFWMDSLEDFLKAIRQDTCAFRYLVCMGDTGEPVGYTGIREIHWRNRSGVAFLFLARKAWGQGIGSDSAAAMMKFAFEKLNLNRIVVHGLVRNEAIYRLRLKVGFREEGILRDFAFLDGKYLDGRIMSMLRSDYESIKDTNPLYTRLQNLG